MKRWEHEGVLDKMQARLDRMPEAMTIRRQIVEHPFASRKAWMGSAEGETSPQEMRCGDQLNDEARQSNGVAPQARG